MKNIKWLVLLSLLFACKKENKQSVASISTIEISNITSNSITTGLKVISNGGSGITKEGICWSIHETPTVEDSSIILDGSNKNEITISLSNLYSYTEYYLRAFALNGNGISYGNEINFKTKTGLATVFTNTPSEIIPLSAKSGGKIASNGGVPIISQGICWGENMNPTINDNVVFDSSKNNSFISKLYPLGSQMNYHVRAFAVNAFGVSYGSDFSILSTSSQTISDIDGNAYPYITIGAQTWLQLNLKVSHYRNGDPIYPGYINNNAIYNNWYKDFDSPTKIGAYTYPGQDSINHPEYGKLYDAIVASDSRGICPIGWHIPTEDDWTTLELYEGMTIEESKNWGSGSHDLRGTIASKLLLGGSSGLNLLITGYLFIDSDNGAIYDPNPNEGKFASYADATPYGSNPRITWGRSFFPMYPNSIMKIGGLEGYGFSVRCIKD